MNTLVTGGAGFIGSHIANALVAAGHQVTVVDDLSTGHREFVPQRARFVQADIATEALAQAFEGPPFDVVFHLAAQTDVTSSVADPLADARINIMGALRLLELCRHNRAGKVVFSSSCTVYGEPQGLPVAEEHPKLAICPYGVSKLSLEEYLFYYRKVHGLDFTVLRYGNAYGPRQSAALEGGVIAIFTDQMLAGKTPSIFGDGEQTRDYVYVGDIVSANLLAMEKGGGMAMNISVCQPTSVNQLFAAIAKAVGSEARPSYAAPRAGEMRHIHLDNQLAGRVLGWRPAFDLALGLAETIAWHRGRHKA